MMRARPPPKPRPPNALPPRPMQLLHRHVAMHWAAIVLQTWFRETLRGGDRQSRNLSMVLEGDETSRWEMRSREGDEAAIGAAPQGSSELLAPKAQLRPAGSFHCDARLRGDSARAGSTLACCADVMSVQAATGTQSAGASLETRDSGFFERKQSFHGTL